MDRKPARTTLLEREITRRRLLAGMALGGASLSLPALLAACGAPTASPSPAQTAASPSSQAEASPSAGASTAAASPTPDPNAPKRGGTFVMAVGEDIPELDPHGLQSLANLQMYEAPYRRHPTEYGKFLPNLAESIESSADGLVHTIKIRAGALFHDGSPVDAAAMVFGLERQAYPDNKYHNGGPYWAGWARGNPGVVSKIEEVDELTVRITLSEPVIDMDFVLADEHGMGVINPDVIVADPEHFGQSPIGAGTGPFKFEERVAGDHVTLVRNEQYWEPETPFLDKWILRVMPDPGSRLLALKSGDIQMFDVSGPEIAQLSADPDVQLITVPPIFGSYISFDHNDPITGDPKVREAISHAIDIASIVGELSPFAKVTPTFGVFPGMPGHRTDLTWYAYDPAKAKAVLAEAGHPDGVDLKLSFSTPPVGLNHSILAQAIQGQLQAAGFRVELVQVDGPTMFESGFGPPGREEYPFQMALSLTGTDGNSFGMLTQWTSATNYAAKNPAYMALFARMIKAVDPDERLGIYGEMQQQIFDDVGYIPLAHSEVVRAAAKNVRGLETAAYHFRDVWLDG